MLSTTGIQSFLVRVKMFQTAAVWPSSSAPSKKAQIFKLCPQFREAFAKIGMPVSNS
jgi:hypothetical protein